MILVISRLNEPISLLAPSFVDIISCTEDTLGWKELLRRWHTPWILSD